MAGILEDLLGGASKGLLDLSGQLGGPGYLSDNRNALMALGLGLASGNGWGEGAKNALQGFVAGGAMDRTQAGQVAMLKYVMSRDDIPPEMKQAMMRNPELAVEFFKKAAVPPTYQTHATDGNIYQTRPDRPGISPVATIERQREVQDAGRPTIINTPAPGLVPAGRQPNLGAQAERTLYGGYPSVAPSGGAPPPSVAPPGAAPAPGSPAPGSTDPIRPNVVPTQSMPGVVWQGAAKPREISPAEITKLREEGMKLTSVTEFTNTFKPEYTGYGAKWVGDKVMTAGRNLPGIKGTTLAESAQWWQGYDHYKNKVRNELFGSALTPTEAAAFEQADVNSGMSADTVAKNLARQRSILEFATSRQKRAMTAAGFDPRVVDEAYGIGEPAREPPNSSPRPGAGPKAEQGRAPEVPPVPNARRARDGNWYVQQGDKWFRVNP